MTRRLAVALAAALAVLLAFAVGAAYASTSTSDIGGFSLDVKQVTETFTSPTTGVLAYKAQCPSGYSPIGGGGYAQRTSPYVSEVPLLSSSPYDDGNLGWQVRYDLPDSARTVFVYATCARIT